MIMKIVFNKQKANQIGREIDDCYDRLDRFFISNGLFKVGHGLYQCDDYCLMARAQLTLPNTAWFLQVVDEWKCNFVSNDLRGMEDCLKSYYRIEAITQKRLARKRLLKKSY